MRSYGECFLTVYIVLVATNSAQPQEFAGTGGDFGGPLNAAQPFTSMGLIDVEKSTAPALAMHAGRFSITHIRDHAILLDSATGRTWYLNVGENEEGVILQWVPIPRMGQRAPESPQPRADHQNSEREDHKSFDPFQSRNAAQKKSKPK
ncbi:MAG: hypothetical protein GXY83_21800 [Rhodopirellula sp.]|nr:hypothetical protein [Rhodopirellula sp.]